MNNTKEEIISLIEDGIRPDEIYKLYQVLYDKEFFSREDFKNDYSWFRILLRDNIINIANNDSDDSINKTLMIKKYLHISPALNWIFAPRPDVVFHNQQNFADTVMAMLGNGKHRIMEVGCGAIPYLSITLAEQYGLVMAMDRALSRGMQRHVLERMCVDSLEINFNKDFDLSNIDVVVGQKPCPSIENIVAKCVSENKPYILEVCHCGEPEDGWKKYLSDKYGSKTLDSDEMLGCMDIVYDLD